MKYDGARIDSGSSVREQIVSIADKATGEELLLSTDSWPRDGGSPSSKRGRITFMAATDIGKPNKHGQTMYDIMSGP